MRKSVIIFIITFLIEVGLTYFITEKLSIRFIELMFFSGLVFSVFSFWFSSSGGTYTRFIDSTISGQTGLIPKWQTLKFNNNPIFMASLVFTLIGLIFFVLLVSEVIPPVHD
jgi:hypothetical protein